eukprot:TRINITY_DN24064_c0_g1_i1.p1 TRINITY_DN24064_c0_g1~~TRINITY_DN24064_c0_g1_i1.p1  ORF type:complete len:238 (-),score=48.54 TRINITY_DN24064_c0_g1_i1:1048-1674(-)
MGKGTRVRHPGEAQAIIHSSDLASGLSKASVVPSGVVLAGKGTDTGTAVPSRYQKGEGEEPNSKRHKRRSKEEKHGSRSTSAPNTNRNVVLSHSDPAVATPSPLAVSTPSPLSDTALSNFAGAKEVIKEPLLAQQKEAKNDDDNDSWLFRRRRGVGASSGGKVDSLQGPMGERQVALSHSDRVLSHVLSKPHYLPEFDTCILPYVIPF